MKKTLLFFGLLAGTLGFVKAQNVNIPDANFKNALLNHTPSIDTNNDGEIQVSEAIAFSGNLIVGNKGIANLTGIEAFVNLNYLDCRDNQLTSLNVNNNIQLRGLIFNGNQISNVDLSQNKLLSRLHGYGNLLTSLDLSKNTELQFLRCEQNQLSSLDVSKNTKLLMLWCSQNNLTSLNAKNGNNANMGLYTNSFDALNNPNLSCIQVDNPSADYMTNWQKDATASFQTVCGTDQIVYIPDANFKNALLSNPTPIDTNVDGEIQLSEAQAFTGEIECYYKNISDLTGIEAFINLKKLNCAINQLTSVDLSKNTALTHLILGMNQLTSLDVSKNVALIYLEFYSNQVTSIDLSKNTSLTSLNCSTNQLISLDVSKNTGLTSLDCGGNQLTGLNVSNNIALQSLSYANNQIPTLVDLSNNPALVELNCSGNQMTELNVSNYTGLNLLSCTGNQLTSLDVTKNTELRNLYISGNYLTTIDISKNLALESFAANENQLVFLDTTKNVNLKYLYCPQNQLTGLDLSKNVSMLQLFCSGNKFVNLDLSKLTNLLVFNGVDNYQLTSINIKNGNNPAIMMFDARNSPNLTCIQVDDPAADYMSSWSWQKDPTATFSTECILAVADGNRKSISIYPNPVKDILNFSEEVSDIKIVDAAGRMVKQFPAKTKSVNVANLAKGVYIISATNKDGKIVNQKIIKE